MLIQCENCMKKFEVKDMWIRATCPKCKEDFVKYDNEGFHFIDEYADESDDAYINSPSNQQTKKTKSNENEFAVIVQRL
jgi:predicted  nucleic acid-binding Zn-ribbon protein